MREERSNDADAQRLLLDRLSSESGLSVTHLRPGDVLMSEGDPAEQVHVLITGSLTVTKQVGDERAVLARVHTPGTVLGEMVFLGGGNRTATVTADSAAELYSLDKSEFLAILDSAPEIAESLASSAARRAEEGELAEILVDRLGLDDPDWVASACAGVRWHILAPDQTLFAQGDPSDAVYFVVRGRLRASRLASGEDDPTSIGEFAKGAIVGDLGVLSSRPRVSTVTAVRRSVVAEMRADDFLAATESRPRLLVDLALAAAVRATEHADQGSPANIIAVAGVSPDRQEFIAGLAKELASVGIVEVLSAARVDGLLATPGVSRSGSGQVGDIRVSRLVHEFELEADHLILDMGDEDDSWSHRCLALADRMLLLSPANPHGANLDVVESALSNCPAGVKRTLVVARDTDSPPAGTAAVFGGFGCDSILNIVRGSPDDVARVARVASGRANVLVIGGGGARGFAHIGAYRALLELGIPIDIVVGTSIGGVIGTVMADGLEPEHLVTIATESFARVLDYTFPSVSLIKGEKITKAARGHFGSRQIEDLRKTFVGVSTDLTTSRPHLHVSGDIVTAIRATCAIPGVMPPVPMGDALLVDGGVLNNLPMDVARTLAPAGKVMAFDVAPVQGPRAYDDFGLSVSGWTAMRSRSGAKKSPYPRITSVLLRSMITASMRERDRQVGSGLSDFYVNLDIRGVSMLDFSNPRGIADRGYEAARPALETWLEASRSNEFPH